MHILLRHLLADLSHQNTAHLRLGGMFAVLICGLLSGYFTGSRLASPQRWAKKIMTAVLVSFNWVIALFVIWQMQLSRQLVWLPLVGVISMLAITASSAAIFCFLKLELRTRLTLILAGGLSNHGYTGGAFVCYALFGAQGLALANLYPMLWVPTAYLIFFPLLKMQELSTKDATHSFKFKHIFDLRFLVLPAIALAVVLNLTNIAPPSFIQKFYLIDILVYVASGLSFFAIGMQVNLARLRYYVNLYFPVAIIKFVLAPVITLTIIWLLALTGQNLPASLKRVIIVLSVTPCAVLTVTISNAFDLDGRLASALWVVTMAIFVAVVVPVLFFIFA